MGEVYVINNVKEYYIYQYRQIRSVVNYELHPMLIGEESDSSDDPYKVWAHMKKKINLLNAQISRRSIN